MLLDTVPASLPAAGCPRARPTMVTGTESDYATCAVVGLLLDANNAMRAYAAALDALPAMPTTRPSTAASAGCRDAGARPA